MKRARVGRKKKKKKKTEAKAVLADVLQNAECTKIR